MLLPYFNLNSDTAFKNNFVVFEMSGFCFCSGFEMSVPTSWQDEVVPTPLVNNEIICYSVHNPGRLNSALSDTGYL